ncbi:diguanylate cyclase [Vibrio sp.]|uniref:TackOD1 domain-containing metal-binding protein n=1 Tax=Vibrio sp. TaxID=678 RepID=UPI003D09DEEC
MVNNERVFFIGEQDTDLTPDYGFVSIDSVEQLPEIPGGLLVLNLEAECQDLQLTLLHQLRHYWSWRVYVYHDSKLSPILSDGIFDANSSFNEWREHQQALAMVHDCNNVDPMVGWLGLDNRRRLVPMKNVQSNNIYHYPLIDIYYPELTSSYRFLMSEIKRDVLEADQLVDRIRVCGECNSGHLNYVEVCPSCHDIDITEKVSLHCFTCGHVADQKQFKRNNKLECPKCLTRLRHIGVDYDRPLETHSCNHCSHSFVEAETMAVCFDCGSEAAISDLIVRKIYQLKLGALGEYTLRHGNRPTAPELALSGNVDVSYFINLLTWVNKMAIRHQETHLLLGLHFTNLVEYANRFGDAKMFALTEQITDRFNGLFRDTDICCQYQNDVLLVFMPKTDISSLPVLQSKIEYLASLIEDDDFSLNVFSWPMPDEGLTIDATAWMERNIGEIYAVQ